MSAPSTQNPTPGNPQFELKAGAFTLPILRLFGTDMAIIAQQLSSKVDQAESFFHNAPVVIDLKEIADEDVDFPILVSLMRGYGMIPVGIRGGSAVQNEAAEILDLAVLADARMPRLEAKQSQSYADQTKTPTITSSTTLITKPIRSGQRVYAQGGDLVVLGQVSSGAEVMADGHIHVYASLRGRALAGLKGNQDARIFCQDLRAELVSVAGHYRISENIDSRLSGHPVQVYLEERILRIDLL